MRTIRTTLAAVLYMHAGAVSPVILSTLRGVYGELAGVVPIADLMRLRSILHLNVAFANQRGYSEFVADMVCVDDAFLSELEVSND